MFCEAVIAIIFNDDIIDVLVRLPIEPIMKDKILHSVTKRHTYRKCVDKLYENEIVVKCFVQKQRSPLQNEILMNT